mmetsp:Transcript_1283/g.2616  ORF Transcript_1283/g.2616 Transcript_1283/m.2616 type:complete len:318 (-) Transcript_1283:118-1071(-)
MIVPFTYSRKQREVMRVPLREIAVWCSAPTSDTKQKTILLFNLPPPLPIVVMKARMSSPCPGTKNGARTCGRGISSRTMCSAPRPRPRARFRPRPSPLLSSFPSPLTSPSPSPHSKMTTVHSIASGFQSALAFFAAAAIYFGPHVTLSNGRYRRSPPDVVLVYTDRRRHGTDLQSRTERHPPSEVATTRSNPSGDQSKVRISWSNLHASRSNETTPIFVSSPGQGDVVVFVFTLSSSSLSPSLPCIVHVDDKRRHDINEDSPAPLLFLLRRFRRSTVTPADEDGVGAGVAVIPYFLVASSSPHETFSVNSSSLDSEG